MIDKEKLYEEIDKDKEMSEEEKRELYFAEIANAEAEEQWENKQN